MNHLKSTVHKAEECTICAPQFSHKPRPVFYIHPKARIVLIGQAPGTKVHKSGIPWDDASGERLRAWMGIDKKIFYENPKIAILPMAFCYPGKGKSGDLPPPKICAKTWHNIMINCMPELQIYILIGQYAQAYYLRHNRKENLTKTVRNYQDYLPKFIPLPHPSPRNIAWFKRNPWFEVEVLPILKGKVKKHLNY